MSTLRAWESRFQFLEPQRSPAGHRLYVEADVERVDAVLRLVAEGLTLAAAVARVASVGPGALPDGEGEALLFSQILQNAHQGIWVSRDGRTRYANRRMAEMMGYSVEELLAIPVLDFFPPDALPSVRARTASIRAGQPLAFTQELRRSDGSMILAEVHSTPLLNRTGRYEGAVSVVNDVTSRHDAETQARLRAMLLDSIGEAVTASTADGTVVYVNAAAERLFRFRAADVLGKDSRVVFPAPEEPKQGPRILALLQKGRGYTGRFKMARRDGTQFVARLTSAAAVDDHGAVVGFVGVMSDQTERDKRERGHQRLERQAETLALLGAQALGQRSAAGSAVTLMLSEAVDATRRLLGADRAAVLEPIPGADKLGVRCASTDVAGPITVPSGSRSFAGYVILARKVVVVDNAAHDERFDVYPPEPDGTIVSAIGAPIYGPDGISGVLVAESSRARRFSEVDTHFVQGMANIIGTALLT